MNSEPKICDFWVNIRITVFEKDQSGRIKSINNFVNDCTLYDMRDIQQSSLILDSFQFSLKSDHTMLLRYMIVKPQS